MTKSKSLKFTLATPLFILVSHYLVVFSHEYMHSFMAWFLGAKSNPLSLQYGGTSWLNILLLANIDENVNYNFLLSSGHGYQVALIAFAGVGIANALLYIISLFLLKNPEIKQRIFLYYFLFWFNIMNLGNFYDYVPIRTFVTHGDVYHFVKGLNVSPWIVYFIAGYAVALLIRQFFVKTLISAYIDLKITSITGKVALLSICVFILFGFFGGFFYAFHLGSAAIGEIYYFLSMTSLLAIPGILAACWPTRDWVNHQLEKFKACT